MRRSAEGVEGVVHAGFVMQQDFASALEHDRRVAQTFLDALEASRKPFIYTSGGAIVVDRAVGNRSDRIVTEETPFEPSSAFAPRAAAERDVMQAASRGIRTIVLRLASVYGRGRSAFIPMMLQFARQAGEAHYIKLGRSQPAGPEFPRGLAVLQGDTVMREPRISEPAKTSGRTSTSTMSRTATCWHWSGLRPDRCSMWRPKS